MLLNSEALLITCLQLALYAPGTSSKALPATHTKPLPTFVLKLEKPPQVTVGPTKLSGTFGQLDLGDGPLIGFNGANRSDAVTLSLNSAGNIVIDSLDIIGYQDPGQTEEILHFDSAADVQAGGGIPAVCDVESGVLKCAAAAGNTHLVLCPGEAVTDDLFLVDVVESGCVEPRLKVVHVK